MPLWFCHQLTRQTYDHLRVSLTQVGRVGKGGHGERKDKAEDRDSGNQALGLVIGHDVMKPAIVDYVDVTDYRSDAPAGAVEHEGHHGPGVRNGDKLLSGYKSEGRDVQGREGQDHGQVEEQDSEDGVVDLDPVVHAVDAAEEEEEVEAVRRYQNDPDSDFRFFTKCLVHFGPIKSQCYKQLC